ncbi:KilA-N domain-containing protein [Pelovirga terrestris]|uniref:KilA-N domain-containing protein n=1 Tax=Pelovirga terrestris TaxID=2771352 RepID=UPI001CD128FF|nr:KilA-N domain-containing protein [Pelovirga terrestris]
MAKNKKIQVQGSEISFFQMDQQDYISLTDIAKHKTDDSSATIGNWMRNRNTIEFLGIWETLYNPNFKPLEFEGFRKQAGLNAFTLSPQKKLRRT